VTVLPTPLDADLGDALAAGMLGPAPTDLPAFERAFVAAVEASGPDPVTAWDRFYDATLERVGPGWGGDVPGDGTVATFTRIWARAAALADGPSVLDVGTCFGFLPLAWAARPQPPRLLAVELSHASAALAARQARRLRRDVTVVRADGARLPLPDRAVGTVTLLHVLEHLKPAPAERVLVEALRVADRRVVVAVPVEPVPDPLFGHVQTFDVRRLGALGARTGWSVQVADADGAWLVLDRLGG
jgi:SAM-dependent methyltransferase